MMALLCWIFGHRLWAKTVVSGTVVIRDGWGNPLSAIQLCERCRKPYFVTIL